MFKINLKTYLNLIIPGNINKDRGMLQNTHNNYRTHVGRECHLIVFDNWSDSPRIRSRYLTFVESTILLSFQDLKFFVFCLGLIRYGGKSLNIYDSEGLGDNPPPQQEIIDFCKPAGRALPYSAQIRHYLYFREVVKCRHLLLLHRLCIL